MSSSSSRRYQYDVFLNFRGKDTRNAFTSHLYTALTLGKIETFMDTRLEKGTELNPGLLRAIEGSRISIVVFSERYAESRWCLDELVKIMQCRQTNDQVVKPIFYHVDPSDVRNQRGGFTCGGSLNYWKKALTDAGNCIGWHVTRDTNESDVIKEIVKDVRGKLARPSLSFIDFPVGLTSRVEDVIQLLERQSSPECVYVLGIWGMGGSGKSVLAKVIYNEICHKFTRRSFIANIREGWGSTGGPVDLQKKLLSDIRSEKVKVADTLDGRCMIQETLFKTRALVVLDDVNDDEQLEALCGNRRWIGLGSVIIITTRDKHVLNVFEADHVYRMEEMNESESLELFSWYAFRKATPKEGFEELSKKVVAYCGRLPLALKVLGSGLYGRKKSVWDELLKKEIAPNDRVQKNLRISYDDLSDFTMKEIFLDICCFFIGKNKPYVTKILDGCKLYAESGILVLIERSLIKIEKNNKLGMHNLLRDMGREIVRQTFPKKLRKRSRLWLNDEARDVLTKHNGTDYIEGLALMLQTFERFETKAFEKLDNLRLLQLSQVQLDGDYKCLPKNLRWLYWQGFPLECIPSEFYQDNLVVIDLRNSNLERVWMEPQDMERLKILNLSHSKYLRSTPDFSKLPNLEHLVLRDCLGLFEIDPSIGDLQNLLLIDLKGCASLISLPKTIYKLKALETLIISGCLKIDKLEEDIVQMGSLTALIAKNTALKQVSISMAMERLNILNLSHSRYLTGTPDFSKLPNLENLILKNCPSLFEIHQSIGDLKNLLFVNLKDCASLENLPRTIYKLGSLKKLIISGCSKIDMLEEDIVQMKSLTTLVAENTAIKKVPFSIARLKSIEYIHLCGYEGLSNDVFPSLIWSWMSPTLYPSASIHPWGGMQLPLVSLYIHSKNLGGLSSLSSLSKLRSVWLQCCSRFQLTQDFKRTQDGLYDVNVTRLETSYALQNSLHALRSLLIGMGSYHRVINTLSNGISQGMTVCGPNDFILPGDNYPYWVSHAGEGHSVAFKVPQVSDYHLKGMILCVIYSTTPGNMADESLISVLIVNYTKHVIQLFKGDTIISLNDKEWEGIVSNLEPEDQVQISVACGHRLVIKKTTLYLIYYESIEEKVEPLEEPMTPGAMLGPDQTGSSTPVTMLSELVQPSRVLLEPDLIESSELDQPSTILSETVQPSMVLLEPDLIESSEAYQPSTVLLEPDLIESSEPDQPSTMLSETVQPSIVLLESDLIESSEPDQPSTMLSEPVQPSTVLEPDLTESSEPDQPSVMSESNQMEQQTIILLPLDRTVPMKSVPVLSRPNKKAKWKHLSCFNCFVQKQN